MSVDPDDYRAYTVDLRNDVKEQLPIKDLAVFHEAVSLTTDLQRMTANNTHSAVHSAMINCLLRMHQPYPLEHRRAIAENVRRVAGMIEQGEV